jgi:hypothetical protein
MNIKNSAVVATLVSSLTLVGCNPSVKNLNGDLVPLPTNCDPLVEYQARHLTVSGIEIPIPELGSVKVGNVIWEKEKLQEAGDAAKLLDMKRINACNLLATRISMMSRPEALKHLDNYEASQDKLMQLALILGSNNPKAPEVLAKFMDTYFSVSTASAPNHGFLQSITEGTQTLEIKEDVKRIPNEELFE